MSGANLSQTASQSSAIESPAFKSLAEKIENRSAKVGIVGLGYVGLPLAHEFSAGGYVTMGFDNDATKVESLSAGKSYIKHVDSGWLQGSEKFSATSDFDKLGEADAILICVPTPLGDARDPDLSYVISSVNSIVKHLRKGQLIVLESTTYPGSTRDVVAPLLEATGLTLGEDFFLAYSPEREDPGNAKFTGRTIPKVVGGYDAACTKLAVSLYEAVFQEVVPVNSCEVAEACKILENVYRSVNIALVNELKVLFHHMEIDIWEVIDAAKTKPFGFQAFYPGPGLGGHCIPIDPFYLSWLARRLNMNTRFIELAGEINTSMPGFVVERIAEALNESGKALRNSNVCIIGVAYKPNIEDARESPAYELISTLVKRGANVTYNDPHVPTFGSESRQGWSLSSQELTPEYLGRQDCSVIVTDHESYDFTKVVERSKLVVDTRNATKGIETQSCKIFKA